MPLPSEYEEYIGEIFDPSLHLREIDQANTILVEFVSALSQNKAPVATLSDIGAAVSTLGKYAGYSTEAHQMELFLESTLAANYRTTSKVLQGFIRTINQEINERLELSAKKESLKSVELQKSRVPDEDIPF